MDINAAYDFLGFCDKKRLYKYMNEYGRLQLRAQSKDCWK
jgi:hypothetical protein